MIDYIVYYLRIVKRYLKNKSVTTVLMVSNGLQVNSSIKTTLGTGDSWSQYRGGHSKGVVLPWENIGLRMENDGSLIQRRC